MTNTPYVMLVGEHLTHFAQTQGLTCQNEEWFKTDYRREQLKEDKKTTPSSWITKRRKPVVEAKTIVKEQSEQSLLINMAI